MVVDIQKIMVFMEKEIESLSKDLYLFENKMRPRYEEDRRILARMKQQQVKIEVLSQKIARGESVTPEELADIPEQFR